VSVSGYFNKKTYQGKMEYKDHILQEVIRQLFLSSRHSRGLTQAELSMASNITRQFISQVEGGKRQPSLNTLSALVNAYHLTLSDFFKEVDRLYPLFETGDFFRKTNIPMVAESHAPSRNYLLDKKSK